MRTRTTAVSADGWLAGMLDLTSNRNLTVSTETKVRFVDNQMNEERAETSSVTVQKTGTIESINYFLDPIQAHYRLSSHVWY
ncbi:MAG: hypothetical protein QMC37_01885, partial [Flavobacteriales bacterium]